MRRYADLKLVWKVLAAPVAVLLLLVVIAAMGVRGLQLAQIGFERLDTGIVQPLADALGAKDRLTLSHARLLSLLTVAANDMEEAKRLAPKLETLAAEMQLSERTIASQTAVWRQQVDAASVDAVMAALEAYLTAARAVIEAAKADVTYGVLVLGDAAARFEALRTRLDAMVATLQGRRTSLTDETQGMAADGRLYLAGLAGVAVIIGLLIAILNARLIARPVLSLTEIMSRLAARDMAIAISGTERQDEVGAMARTVQVFRASMIEADTLMDRQLSEHIAKEQRRTTLDQRTRAFGQSTANVMGSLGRSADGMRQAAAAMMEATTGVRAQSGATAQRAVNASRDLASVAAAIEQLTASVDQITHQVGAAAEVAREAVQRASNGQDTMRQLTEATDRIGDVVQLISTIAGQTNLLALNATIEAARAGESGKGFAVVAGEVKTLAAQTAKATSDISRQMAAVRDATGQSIQAMAEVSRIIGRMDEVAAAVAMAVEQQSVTTREIASSVQAVSDTTNQTAQAMAVVAGGADNAGTVSRAVLDAATTIGSDAERLRAEVDQFLLAVREEPGGGPEPSSAPVRAAA